MVLAEREYTVSLKMAEILDFLKFLSFPKIAQTTYFVIPIYFITSWTCIYYFPQHKSCWWYETILSHNFGSKFKKRFELKWVSVIRKLLLEFNLNISKTVKGKKSDFFENNLSSKPSCSIQVFFAKNWEIISRVEKTQELLISNTK